MGFYLHLKSPIISIFFTSLLYFVIYYLKILDKQAVLLPYSVLQAGRGHAEVKLDSTCGITPNLVGFKQVNAEDYQFLNPFNLTKEKLNIGQSSDKKCFGFKTAIIIPYRDRLEQLSVFLQHTVPIFERQNLNYEIFVIEQDMNTPFNRGLLLNIGYSEAKKNPYFTCYVFSDVDFLLENDRVSYSCIDSPMHLMAAANTYHYKLLYLKNIGGILSIWGHHFEQVNGFSNTYWGWGSEDDDFSIRLLRHDIEIKRQDFNIIRYHQNKIKHKRRDFNNISDRIKKIMKRSLKHQIEGLNSLLYKIIERNEYSLFQHIRVDTSVMFNSSANVKNNN